MEPMSPNEIEWNETMYKLEQLSQRLKKIENYHQLNKAKENALDILFLSFYYFAKDIVNCENFDSFIFMLSNKFADVEDGFITNENLEQWAKEKSPREFNLIEFYQIFKYCCQVDWSPYRFSSVANQAVFINNMVSFQWPQFDCFFVQIESFLNFLIQSLCDLVLNNQLVPIPQTSIESIDL